ncbi:MAG: ABC transporter substrate-binding protein [Planctomycetota bacterium]
MRLSLLMALLILPLMAGDDRPLVVARGADCVGLDPANILDGESAKVSVQVFETLVRFKPGSTEVEPCLASSWTTSEDGLTWDFTLRDKVIFHDGTGMDAAAVVFSFQRQMDKNHKAHKGTFEYWALFSDVAAVEATGPMAVRFTLKRPFAPFLANLAMFSAAIISPASWEKSGEGIIDHPVGTGPYMFVEWRRRESVTLKAFKEYWGPQAHCPLLVFKVVEKSPVRLALLKKGEIDIADGLSPVEIEAAAADKDLRLAKAVGMNVAYLAMNADKGPFKDARVRRAVRLALDRSQMALQLFRGYGQVAVSPLPSCLWGTDPSLKAGSADPEASRKLLAEAGCAEGFTCTLSFGNNPRPYLPEPKKAALLVKNALKAVGITVNLEEMEWGSFLEHTKQGKHEMCLMGWNGDNGDPDNFLTTLLSSETAQLPAMNLSFFRDPQVDSWLKEAQVTSKQEAREALYRQVLRRVDELCPMVPLFHAEQVAVHAAGVRGFMLHPDGLRSLGAVQR